MASWSVMILSRLGDGAQGSDGAGLGAPGQPTRGRDHQLRGRQRRIEAALPHQSRVPRPATCSGDRALGPVGSAPRAQPEAELEASAPAGPSPGWSELGRERAGGWPSRPRAPARPEPRQRSYAGSGGLAAPSQPGDQPGQIVLTSGVATTMPTEPATVGIRRPAPRATTARRAARRSRRATGVQLGDQLARRPRPGTGRGRAGP